MRSSSAHRRIDEARDFGKGDDIVEFALDFGALHAQDAPFRKTFSGGQV